MDRLGHLGTNRLRALLALSLALGLCALLPTAAGAWQIKHVDYRGIQHLHYRYGQIYIHPGQNSIEFRPDNLRPRVAGYITRFSPNLTYLNGTVPPVDVIHLHHGVWLIDGYPTFAAGEEKTIVQIPRGYGYRYSPKDTWILNYMIHNLTPTPTRVYVTYDLDFVPMTSPAARHLRTVRTQWMDVKGIQAYPVFDVLRYSGHHCRYTFPDDAPPGSAGPAQTWTVPQDGSIVETAVHLHPGGLYGDLRITRNGRTRELFRSYAHYFEPAGAVSWDVAMTTTPPNWRVHVLKGDVITVHGTYDSCRAAWYESMAIMPMAYSAGDPSGVNPFKVKTAVKGRLTHGHLPENNHHGGGPFGLPNAETLLNGPLMDGNTVTISNFTYGQGDLSSIAFAGRPPIVHEGQSLWFLNKDSGINVYHTITACKSPCNRETGIAYPLANGPHEFDSGELGYGPAGLTPAANRNTWNTPVNLPPGTYTYFCRIHPFMRGSFRVVR